MVMDSDANGKYNCRLLCIYLGIDTTEYSMDIL